MNGNDYRKNDDIKKQTRTVYLILAVSLIVLALLITVSVISARRSSPPKHEGDSTVVTDAPDTSAKKPESTSKVAEKKPEDTSKAEENVTPKESDTDASVEPSDVLPDFHPISAGEIIKGYSVSAPVYSQTMDDYRVHAGIDVSAPIGSDVYAAASGTVSAVWDDPMNGCCLSIRHSGGAVSTYANLSRDTLDAMKPGMEVKGGTAIGTVGDTSLVEIADEAHVHYELTVNGESVDPTEYIDFSQNRDNYAE